MSDRHSSGSLRPPRRRGLFGGASSAVRLAGLVIIGFTIAMPFIWMISASFKPHKEVEEVYIVPQKPTLQNYPKILNLVPIQKGDPTAPPDSEQAQDRYLDLQFGRWYFNNVFIAVAVTVLQVLTSAMAAYAFSRIRWRGRDTVFLLYLATMMIPGVVTMIPNFQIMVWLGFINTYHGLILPAAFSAFGTFLLRQFMLSIPPSLDEAATIDGAGHWRIFWNVIMPLARPGLIALGILTFLGAYKSFFWPLIMLSDQQYYPMSVGLLQLDSSYGRQTELIMAAAVMNVVPMIIVFVIFQKLMVKGLQLGGVKG